LCLGEGRRKKEEEKESGRKKEEESGRIIHPVLATGIHLCF
jgi:hypothetical protein